MSQMELLALGFIAGVIPDVLRLVALKTQGAPSYLSSWFFWVSLLILGLLGLFAVWLIKPSGIVEAFAVGYSAPEILARLGGKLPKGIRDRSLKASPPDVKSLREWGGM